MVAGAQQDREKVERKNDQLRSQLKETEQLLTSHQEQLAELKEVMQQMHSDRDEVETNANMSTAPSTPGLYSQENVSRMLDVLNLSPASPGLGSTSPAPPTSFTFLLKPVCRTDVQAFHDFEALLRVSKASAPSSRVNSGSYNGLNVMGIGNLGGHSQPQHNNHTANHTGSNGSGSSVSSSGTHSSTPTLPHLPVSSSTKSAYSEYIPLKETRFYKRVLTEDIEPTLRLDTAPGLSWLTKRTVLSSVCDGSLVVEPMPNSTRKYIDDFACSTCGERRKGPEFGRTHCFRTNDNETAQRYPLCPHCLGRFRACCDFLGFLRMIKDGHWRTDSADAEKEAWDESIRLRERMFWSRMGGGVVPAFVQAKDLTVHAAEDSERYVPSKLSHEIALDENINHANKLSPSKMPEDPFHSDKKRASIGRNIISNLPNSGDEEKENALGIMADGSPKLDAVAENGAHKQQLQEGHDEPSDGISEEHLKNKPEPAERPTTAASAQTSEQRLGLTIPGSFDS